LDACALSLSIVEWSTNAPSSLETRAPLDGIDSSKGYIRGNVQIVCRFINQWKSYSTDERFLRLLKQLRSHFSFINLAGVCFTDIEEIRDGAKD
jgi:hypothetical protein